MDICMVTAHTSQKKLCTVTGGTREFGTLIAQQSACMLWLPVWNRNCTTLREHVDENIVSISFEQANQPSADFSSRAHGQM